jgi:hypothetical protein
MLLHKTFLVVLIVLLASVRVGAQEQVSLDQFKQAYKLEFVGAILDQALGTPLTINKSYIEELWDSLPKTVFKGLTIQPKTFETAVAGQAGLGFSYSYSKDFKLVGNKHLGSSSSAGAFGLDLSLASDGNFAFAQVKNPADFSKSVGSVVSFLNLGGAVASTEKQKDRLDELELKLVLYKTYDALRSSPELKEFMAIVSQCLTTQYYMQLSANTSLEANQDYTKKNYTYGLQLGLEIKDWNPEGCFYNVLDYPLAALRVLDGADDSFRPRGNALPSVLFNLDQVIPTKTDPRYKLDPNAYSRVNFEIDYKTLIGSLNSSRLFFESSYRVYKDLSPSDTITKAGLNLSQLLTLSLRLDNGLFVSYSTGKLPFDRQNDKTYQIGWGYKF